MGKITAMIIMLVLSTVATGCDMVKKSNKEESDSRVQLLYEPPKGGIELDSWSGEADFDFDGEAENIDISVTELADTYSQDINISVGEYSKTIHGDDSVYILAIYACDIDNDDKYKDLAIFTEELSADPKLYILKYNNLEAYSFVGVDYDGEPREEECLWLGYCDKPYLEINEDDSIILREQTNSRGMWDMHKKHYLNNEGKIVEEKQDSYVVVKDYMAEPGDWMEFVDEREEEMWCKGYIRAYTDFEGNLIDLEEGDYFEVLLDDDDNNLFIRKENGEEGWINIDTGDYMDTLELNDKFFMMAG